MTTIAALLAAWEGSTGKHTWRNPTAWDAGVLRALMEWRYQPGDVERLPIGAENPRRAAWTRCGARPIAAYCPVSNPRDGRTNAEA